MSIGVQNTNAALLALQTLNRLNDPSQTGDSGGTGGIGQTAPASTTSPSTVIDAAAVQSLGAGDLSAASASLDQASSITDTALSAGLSVSDLLTQMKTLAGEVESGTTSGADASQDFASLLSQVKSTIAGASFDGVNLLDGSTGGQATVGAGTSGQTTLNATNLSLGGSVITLAATSTLSTASSAADVLDNIDASLANLGQALDQMGDQSRQIAAHASFVTRLSDVLSLSGSISTPDSADGAKLMALQVQQQLQMSGGAIGNAQPNVLLTLFK